MKQHLNINIYNFDFCTETNETLGRMPGASYSAVKMLYISENSCKKITHAQSELHRTSKSLEQVT